MDASQPYKNVATVDDHDRDQDESSTEVDESLIGDEEKQWDAIDLHNGRRRHNPSTTRIGRLLGTLRHHRWLVDTSLLLIILGLILLRQVETRTRLSPPWQVGGDYTGEGPHFATKVVKWDADESFVPAKDAEFASNETLARWNTLMPKGTGWGNPDTTFFTTTMTHQLHCILMMGRIYTSLRTGTNKDLPEDYHSHYLHCIDYLRQAAMCAGDVALEAHEPSDASDNGPLDGGWSGHHVCKDYGEVIHYLEDQIKDGVRTVLPVDD